MKILRVTTLYSQLIAFIDAALKQFEPHGPRGRRAMSQNLSFARPGRL
jgi:hypothetical protein